MKQYGFTEDAQGEAVIFEIDTPADPTYNHKHEFTSCTDIHRGEIIGISEWGWVNKEYGARICAGLEYFSENSIEEIKKLIEEKKEFDHKKELLVKKFLL